MVVDGLVADWERLVIAMPRWNDIAATHNKNDSRVRWKIDETVCFFRQADVPGFVCSCACSLSHCMSPSFNPWTSPAFTDAMPWVHRGLSSGPCKPRRPLFTLQPNGYAKLPFMCHRHDRHKRPRLLSSRRRTQAFCSGTRQLAWLLSLCSRRENRPPRLLPPLRKVSYHSGRPFALLRGDGSLHLQHPTTKHECCICTVVSLQSVYVRGRGAKTDLEQRPRRRTPPSAPPHRASGSPDCQPEPLQTLRRYSLGTCRRGGASRACEP